MAEDENEEECNVPMMLRAGISHGFGGVSEIQQGKYSPQKVGGWKIGDGEIDQELEVPDCPE